MPKGDQMNVWVIDEDSSTQYFTHQNQSSSTK